MVDNYSDHEVEISKQNIGGGGGGGENHPSVPTETTPAETVPETTMETTPSAEGESRPSNDEVRRPMNTVMFTAQTAARSGLVKTTAMYTERTGSG